METARHITLAGWMQLLRPPNLLTVPGDPAAGFLLASAPAGPHTMYGGMLPAAAISLLFYMAGMVGNDCFDRREDAAARPERPIPSGAVSLRSAVIATVLLFSAGLILAGLTGGSTLAAALILMLLVIAYNWFGKRIPVLGSLLMGACRGGSLLLGATATGLPFGGLNAVTVIAAAGTLMYIAAVTSLAANETEKTPVAFRRWLPAVAVIGGMSGLFAASATAGAVFAVLALAAAGWPLFLAWKLTSCPEPKVLIVSIGAFIRGLLLIQAAWMAFAGGPGLIAAVPVLCAWPVGLYLSRWFYAS